MSILARNFYASLDVQTIARKLLGKCLCTRIDGCLTVAKIVETEAYKAPEDKASHAYSNRRTKRTETMFGAPGHTYIYLCYGIHHLFNVVTGPRDTAHAVLVRALEPLDGLSTMLKRRKLSASSSRLTAGPGVLTQAMGLTTGDNGIDLTNSEKVWIADHGLNVLPEMIISSPRVGVDYAEECANWNWRFRIKNNPWTSKPH